MTAFKDLPKAPKDPIFTIAEEAKKAGAGKIDASIGILLDEEGKPFVYECVKEAITKVAADAERAAPYPPLTGDLTYRTCVTELILGKGATAPSIATNGGTGAIEMNLLLAREMGIQNAILPLPSWPNHKRMLKGRNMNIVEVPFLEKKKPTLDPLLDAMTKQKEPHLLILQGSSHNPTGKLWTSDEWKQLGAAVAASNHVALLDLPYQGLGRGMEEDMEPVRILKDAGATVLVAWSASKNHGIYAYRAGLALAITEDDAEGENIESWYRILTREIYGAANIVGQDVVTFVQTQKKDAWQKEIDAMREGLDEKRVTLMEAFPEWADDISGSGLYTVLPLSEAQVIELKKQKVFVTADGRVNIGGLPRKDMERFIGAIKSL